MGILIGIMTSIADATLGGIRWLVLALACGAVWLAELLDDATDRLRQ